jgi:hypothetical protein
VREAVARGFEVRALARFEAKAERLRSLGAIPVLGDSLEPARWVGQARGAEVLIDLTQPELPSRIRSPGPGGRGPRSRGHGPAAHRSARRALARRAPAPRLRERHRRPRARRAGWDRRLLAPAGRAAGLGRIGVRLRRVVEAAGAKASFLYLGTVYGPGRSFASSLFPRLARGRMTLPAPALNRYPLIYVLDAARAVVHLAALERGWRAAAFSWWTRKAAPASGNSSTWPRSRWASRRRAQSQAGSFRPSSAERSSRRCVGISRPGPRSFWLPDSNSPIRRSARGSPPRCSPWDTRRRVRARRPGAGPG